MPRVGKRRELLEAAFAEFHLHGFQAASLDAIVARAGVTKGALYHHFPDKSALGHAVIDEVVRPGKPAEQFTSMLRAALDDNGRAEVWIKPHPEVSAGRARG